MIDNQTFRNAMARLATGVCIITSDGPGGICGCTVSSVCSVSDDPPTLLVCIKRSSQSNATLKKNQRLCVNILRAHSQEVARLFAQSGVMTSARFSGPEWIMSDASDQINVTGSKTHPPSSRTMPVLVDALVSLQCDISDQAEIGSHTVFYCQIDQAQFGLAGAALTYFERDFQAVSAPAIF